MGPWAFSDIIRDAVIRIKHKRANSWPPFDDVVETKESTVSNIETYLVSPQPLALSNSNNSFVSNWGDKRSAGIFGISAVFYGGAPDGYAWLETSNAPSQAGSNYGGPNNSGDDAQELPGSQVTIALNPLTGLWGAQWQVSNNGAHYVRVRYTANSNHSGLSVNIYLNAVKYSP